MLEATSFEPNASSIKAEEGKIFQFLSAKGIASSTTWDDTIEDLLYEEHVRKWLELSNVKFRVEYYR